MKKYLLIISLLYFTIIDSISQGQKIDSVNCYIQLQDLWDLDLNKGTVKADFYLCLEYKDPLNKEINILNGTVLKIDTLLNNDSLRLFTLRVNAELRNNFSFRKFPIDNQIIEIELEPFQYLEDLVLYSKPNQNIIVDIIHLSGWIVSGINYSSKINKYKIFENNEIKEYNYSVQYYEIPIIKENKTSYFFKTFLPSFVSILILFVGFILYQNQIDLRINLAVGSIFVIISNLIVTQRYLPNVSEFTLIEKINIGSLLIVFMTILYFVASYRLRENLSLKQWSNINRIYIILATFLYSIMLFILLIN